MVDALIYSWWYGNSHTNYGEDLKWRMGWDLLAYTSRYTCIATNLSTACMESSVKAEQHASLSIKR